MTYTGRKQVSSKGTSQYPDSQPQSHSLRIPINVIVLVIIIVIM
jgi:hypothetical protein